MDNVDFYWDDIWEEKHIGIYLDDEEDIDYEYDYDCDSGWFVRKDK